MDEDDIAVLKRDALHYLDLVFGNAKGSRIAQPETENDHLDCFYAMMARPTCVEDLSYRSLPIADWYDDSRVGLVIGHAKRGNKFAHKALQGAVVQFRRNDLSLPSRLAAYVESVFLNGVPNFKRGQKTFIARDMGIAVAILMLHA